MEDNKRSIEYSYVNKNIQRVILVDSESCANSLHFWKYHSDFDAVPELHERAIF